MWECLLDASLEHGLLGMCRLALLLLVGAVTATGATCPADSKHRCTSVESIAAGSFSGETWVPDSGCFVATPTPEEMLRILRGSWLVICGRSNAMVTSRALMNQVSPHAFMVSVLSASACDASPPDRPPVRGCCGSGRLPP